MRVGTAQFNILWEDKAANQITCERLIGEASHKGVQLIVFPEMTLTGFTMHVDAMGEDFESSQTVGFFSQCALKYKIAIAFGVIIMKEEKAFNCCVIVDEGGRVICNYAKIHPFSAGREAGYYTGGDQLAFCQVGNFVVAPTICYDLRFPELYQALSKKAGLILVLANWPDVRAYHWDTLLKARAMENQSYLIGSNKVGPDLKQNYLGGSAVIHPSGQELASAGASEGLGIADICMNEVRQTRQAMDLKADRREQLYQKWFLENDAK